MHNPILMTVDNGEWKIERRMSAVGMRRERIELHVQRDGQKGPQAIGSSSSDWKKP